MPVLARRSRTHSGRSIIVNNLDDTWRGTNYGLIEERMKELVQTWGFQIPIHGEDPLAIARQNPGNVGQCHRAASPTFVGVKGDDLALVGLTHWNLRSPPGRLASAAAAQ